MCIWTSVSTSFSGTAHSVTFTGPADEMGISDITLNSTRTALPEPSSIYLLAAGLAGNSSGEVCPVFLGKTLKTKTPCHQNFLAPPPGGPVFLPRLPSSVSDTHPRPLSLSPHHR